MFKRIMSGVLAAVCIVSSLCLLAGCGQSKPRNNDSAADDSDSDNLPVLVIASDDYAPFNYLGDGGEITGIDVDIAREACRRIGYEPEFRQISWETKDEKLENGEADCLWGCFSMNGREDKYAWAGPYMYSYQVVVVRSDSAIRSLDELEGRRVSVQIGSKAEEIFTHSADSGVPVVKNVYCFNGVEQVFSALRKGYVDACAGHKSALLYYINTMGQGGYRILDGTILKSRLGVAFRADDKDAPVDEMSEALEEMKNDGTIADILDSYGLDSKELLEG